MKPAEFINLAGTLSVQTDAARIRTSISRAYYGSFHSVLAFLNAIGVPGGKRHDLHKLLLGCGHANARDVGILLSYLYEFRQKADYDLLNPRMEVFPPKLRIASFARGVSRASLNSVNRNHRAAASKWE